MPVQAPDALGSARDLLRRFKKAKERKALWDSHISECYDYAIPHREIQFDTTKGQKKNVHVYDETAVAAVQSYANRVMSTLMPPWREWIMLTPGSETPEEEDTNELQELLDQQTKILFSHLWHSNIATEAHEAIQDLAISTGALILDADPDNPQSILKFQSVPLAQIFPEEGPFGSIETVWREWEMPARNMVRHWPDASWSDKTAKFIKETPEKPVRIVHGVVYEPKADIYHTVVLESKENHLAWTEQHNTSPWIVFRENVVPGEILGRGRVMQVLPAIKTANAVVEYTLRNAALAMGGVYTALDDGILNPYTTRIEPFMVIPVASNDRGNPSLRALERSGDFNVGELVLTDLRTTINRHLLAEPFGNVEQTPGRTATEWTLRQNELMMHAASSFGRLQTEMVERIVRRAVDILSSEGKMPPMRVDGREVSIKHTSPLARAQDQEDLMNLQTALEINSSFGMEVLAGAMRIEDIPQYVNDKLGIDADLNRSESEKQQLQQAVIQMLAAAQQQQQEPQQ